MIYKLSTTCNYFCCANVNSDSSLLTACTSNNCCRQMTGQQPTNNLHNSET